MNEATAGGTRVRMIPATVRRYATTRPLTERLRVAAYARVSTDDEEMCIRDSCTDVRGSAGAFRRFLEARLTESRAGKGGDADDALRRTDRQKV